MTPTVLRFPRVEPEPSEQLERLLAERERLRIASANVEQDLAALCRLWSDSNGYRVILKPEQMQRALKVQRHD